MISPTLRSELQKYFDELNALVFSDVGRFDEAAETRAAVELLLEVNEYAR